MPVRAAKTRADSLVQDFPIPHLSSGTLRSLFVVADSVVLGISGNTKRFSDRAFLNVSYLISGRRHISLRDLPARCKPVISSVFSGVNTRGRGLDLTL
ncbi:MAG: hypothetical protein LBG96_12725 [Tannerella sp.]|jgi:hypothetical protein|nr:hypothetical protein [Tannerella sp.]